jgi:anti-sigma regulatory factor (Ser/Thr protein kinase)
VPNLREPNGAAGSQPGMITEFQGQWRDAGSLVFSRAYRAIDAAVPQARAAITEYAARAGATAEQLDAVRLATSEAVTNVVRYAYRGSDGEVRLTATVVENELWVLVADDGCGHQTPTDQPGLGLGIALMATMSVELVLAERAEGGTEARMRFLIGVDGARPD